MINSHGFGAGAPAARPWGYAVRRAEQIGPIKDVPNERQCAPAEHISGSLGRVVRSSASLKPAFVSSHAQHHWATLLPRITMPNSFQRVGGVIKWAARTRGSGWRHDRPPHQEESPIPGRNSLTTPYRMVILRSNLVRQGVHPVVTTDSYSATSPERYPHLPRQASRFYWRAKFAKAVVLIGRYHSPNAGG